MWLDLLRSYKQDGRADLSYCLLHKIFYYDFFRGWQYD